jgi:beta-xylosidase
MIEAVKIWNEPNNKSHWDPNIDPEWDMFARMVRLAGQAIAAENSGLTRVLGGMSPIDPAFLGRLQAKGALDEIDAVAVHGFPLDWNLWGIDDWPAKLAEIQAVTDKPVWVTEVGVSSFGSEEVQAWGVKRTAELLIGRAPRIHWYSLYLRPAAHLGGHHPPQGGRGLVLLPALPYGPAARGRFAQARAGDLCRLRWRDGPVPVVPLSRPSAR